MVVFYQTKFPVIDISLKRKVQQQICDGVISGKPLDDYDLMLLVVMNSCKMVRKNFGSTLQYIKLRGKIHEITEFRKTESDAQAMIRALHSAINRAIMASNVSLHV